MKCVQHTCLAIQNSPQRKELFHNLALNLMDFAGILVALVCSDPAHVSHRSIIALYMKLIFQTNRQTMQRTYFLSMSFEIIIELFCPLECLIKENLMQTIILSTCVSEMTEEIETDLLKMKSELIHII